MEAEYVHIYIYIYDNYMNENNSFVLQLTRTRNFFMSQSTKFYIE